ncbi:hypothetical protein NP233_g1794 [Leucocoprinus birnbaumii]|uniref:MYND-type domain-containing protein n=1 Tax=Leucocoprinus birnbaumii TaxID=56174 RepID=A0AAD5VZE8_9AGAR|nr:hypothetical protein NP233_g1794 [Leucocoprinus birnbaumii]
MNERYSTNPIFDDCPGVIIDKPLTQEALLNLVNAAAENTTNTNQTDKPVVLHVHPDLIPDILAGLPISNDPGDWEQVKKAKHEFEERLREQEKAEQEKEESDREFWKTILSVPGVQTVPMDLPNRDVRTVSVPLQKLEKCHQCGATQGLRLCNSCASAVYCSPECQKKAWKEHKKLCAHSHQINLKNFHPYIAYLFENLRRNRDPGIPVHHSFGRKIISATVPRVIKSSCPTEVVRHKVTLGGDHDLAYGYGLPTWWKGNDDRDQVMKLYYQAIREVHIPELTAAICMTLLAEIYSSDFARNMDDMFGGDVTPQLANEKKDKYDQKKPCFRLEYGKRPISDFGICRGSIRGTENAVQVWDYYDPRTGKVTTLTDPDNYYWLYFKTLTGEELTLDCCSYSFGMEAFVDASSCVHKLPEHMRVTLSARCPAFFRTRQDQTHQPYDLVEEKRFSVMHNTRLHDALTTRSPQDETPEQKAIIRDFLNEMLGRQCTEDEEEKVRSYRLHATVSVNEVLSQGYWKEWDKPVLYRENPLDRFDATRKTMLRGAPAAPRLCMTVKSDGFPGN